MKELNGSSSLPLRLTSLVALLVGVGIVAFTTPGSAQVPSYISSMSDYQVRALSGSFVPIEGSTIQSVTPSEWLTSDPIGSLTGVIDAWSGGPKPQIGTKLYVHGGGHQDSANNGLYVFDFSGTTRPTGWSIAAQSRVSAVQQGAAYADGLPSAAHTYDGMVTGNGSLYRFGGGAYFVGAFRMDAWKFNLSTNAWTRLGDLPSLGNDNAAPTSFYDPVSGKILVTMGGAGNGPFEYWIFRTANDTYKGPQRWPSGNTIGQYKCGAYDTTRGRGILFGDGQVQLVTVNWSSETASIASQTVSSLPDLAGPSCFYDAASDRYWVFGGSPGGAWSTIYEVNPATFVATAHPLSGDRITVNSGMTNSFGRLVFMPTYRAVGLVESHTSPAYVIKLPAAGPPQPSPMAPAAVQLR